MIAESHSSGCGHTVVRSYGLISAVPVQTCPQCIKMKPHSVSDGLLATISVTIKQNFRIMGNTLSWPSVVFLIVGPEVS